MSRPLRARNDSHPFRRIIHFMLRNGEYLDHESDFSFRNKTLEVELEGESLIR